MTPNTLHAWIEARSLAQPGINYFLTGENLDFNNIHNANKTPVVVWLERPIRATIGTLDDGQPINWQYRVILNVLDQCNELGTDIDAIVNRCFVLAGAIYQAMYMGARDVNVSMANSGPDILERHRVSPDLWAGVTMELVLTVPFTTSGCDVI